ncbi:MAG: hypothetical protein NVSMB47_07120 [Polyangiales bacterium]
MSHLLELVLRFVLTGVSVLLVAAVLPGMRVKSFGDALAFAVVVALLNAIAWHFLALLTIPFAVITLGIGALIVNGLIFLGAKKIVRGVEISGCLVAAIASVLVSVVNSAILWVLR